MLDTTQPSLRAVQNAADLALYTAQSVKDTTNNVAKTEFAAHRTSCLKAFFYDDAAGRRRAHCLPLQEP